MNRNTIRNISITALITWAFTRSLHISTFHMAGILVFICVFLLRRSLPAIEAPFQMRYPQRDATRKTVSVILAVWLSLFTVMGDYKGIIGDLTGKAFILVIFIITGSGLFLLYRDIMRALYAVTATTGFGDSDISASFSTLRFAALLLILWLPHFLANFPGIMTVDSLNQYGQLRDFIPPSNHHPYAHTLFIGLCLQIGRIFGGESTAIAAYTIIQMIIMAAIYGYTADTARRLGAPRLMLWMIAAFYGLLPYNALYAMTMWKDILFSGMVLLLTNVLIRVFSAEYKRIHGIILAGMLSALFMCLFRSNGLPAFILTLPLAAAAMEGKKRRITVLSVGICIIACVIIITGPLYTSLSLKKADTVEALSIPIQMAARVYADGEAVSPGDDAAWSNILDTGRIAEEYEDFCSDHMKNLIREGNQQYLSSHMGEVASLWLRFGLSHPMAYIRGFIDATRGYYYPDVANRIGADYSIAPNEYGLSPLPVLKGNRVIKTGEILMKLPDMVPLYGLLYSPGAFFQIYCVLFGGIFIMGDKRQRLRAAAAFMPNLAVFATLMAATPVNNEFRYIYSLVLCMPLYFAMYQGAMERGSDMRRTQL